MDKADRFLISIVELNVDIDTIVRDCLHILEMFKRVPTYGTDFTKPYSITLSENFGFTGERKELVNYTEVHNQRYFDRPNQAQLKKTYANTALSDLVEKLPFPFSIMRLSILPPSTIIGMHTDASCHAQLAIKTNEDCFVAARSGETKHVPVDGNLYVISTTLPHTAFNASQDERIHLSISIFDEDYVQMLRG